MKKGQLLVWIILLALGCKKPFTPTGLVSDNSHYLVVEGVITGNDSTFIKLSRTKKVDTLRTVFPEANAQVSVESDANGSTRLTEIAAGTYAAAALNIDGSHKYRLRIKTSDNKEYLSDYVPVKNAPPIDSISFAAKAAGVQIYVSSHDPANATRYYRWDYTEAWQFHSMYLSLFYSNGIDSLKPRRLDQQIYDCFGSDVSSSIAVASTAKLASDVVYMSPITNVEANSEKIETKYSIEVKEYALTSDAYEFWENLQKNTEKLGSIFDVLPSETQSNFHCVSDPNELVVGYLSAGNNSTKRIFITAAQLLPSYKPRYPDECEVDTVFNVPPRPGKQVDLIPLNSPWLPIKGLYLHPPTPMGKPDAFTYSTKGCIDCTLRGTKAPPPFWK